MHMVEFPLESGGSIFVEVHEAAGAGPVAATRGGGGLPEQAGMAFEKALEPLKSAAQALLSTIRGLGQKPDEVSIEFSLKLDGKFGVIFTTVGAEANFTVSVKWTGDKAA